MDAKTKARLKACDRVIFKQDHAGANRAERRAAQAALRRPGSARNYRLGKATAAAMLLNPKLRT